MLALRSIEFRSFTDPDYENYKISSFVVCFGATTMYLEGVFLKSLERNKSLTNINWMSCEDLYSPTRDWTDEARRNYALKKGIDALLGVGYQFYAEGSTVYSSGSISSPLTSQSEYEIVLFDWVENRKAWVGKVGVINRGTYFAGNAKGEAKALAKRLIKELRKSGHI